MSASAVERQRISELEELVATLQEENYFLRQRASKGSAIRVVNHYEQEPPFPSTKPSGSEAAPPAHRPPSGENLNNLQNPLLKSSAAPVQELSQFASQHVGAAFTPADPETGSTLNVNHDSPSDDFLVNQQDPSWSPGASGPTAASTIAADEEWFKFRPRALWLIGLLCLQSTSSFVLAGFKDLIQRHPSIVYFLTMLVGAGGNAGGQAVVYAVRRLALNLQSIGFLLGAALSAATAVRTAVQRITSFHTGCALSGAMFFIVLFAVAFGTLLPQAFQKVGIDPAHATATIQVGMDIFGICIACLFATIIYEITEPAEMMAENENIRPPAVVHADDKSFLPLYEYVLYR